MKWLSFLGKALISIGFGFLLFVAWILWGTGLYTEREQHRLEERFDTLPSFEPVDTNDGSAGPPEGYRPDPGEPVFRIDIPSIDVSKVVVEGVDTEDLRKGPGHYPYCRSGFELCTKGFKTAWPGQDGRVLISGHRTTYGAPFWDLDKLGSGDDIHIETRWGDFTYSVVDKVVVDDTDSSIVIPGDGPEVVLTTCNPRFSAEQRLIVYAELEEA
ncbi:MAG: sortase [Actinomycetota bacterium]